MLLPSGFFFLLALHALPVASLPTSDDDEWTVDAARDSDVFDITEEITHGPLGFESLGVRGVNFDMDGKRPYINCESYNREVCPNGKCPEKTVKCYLSGEQTRLGCYAAWLFNTSTTHHDTSSMMFGLKGCWDEHMFNKGECLEEEDCVADIRQAGKDDTQRSLFCCCRTHNCNHKTTFTDPITPMTKSPDVTEPEAREVSFLEMFHTTDLWYVFVVLGFLIFAGVVCLIAYYCYRERRLVKATRANASQLPLISTDCHDETLLSTVDQTPMSEIHPPLPSTFVLGEEVGGGRFGSIVRAKWHSPQGQQEVACKVFHYDDADSFVKEVSIFRTPLVNSSPHVLRYIAHESRRDGVESNRIYTEFHANGSLFDFLTKRVVSLEQAFRLLTTMMEGLAFLHEEIRRGPELKPIIVHRDFKSKNVLVKKDLSACISDFGLSMVFESNKKPSGDKETIHTQVGTRRYMSPEVLDGATEFTPMAFRQVDVYAAGLVVWEVLSRTLLPEETESDVGGYALPFADIEPKQLGEFRRHIKLLKTRPKVREALEKNEFTKPVVETMYEMWYQEPDGRVPSGCVRERFLTYEKTYLDSLRTEPECPDAVQESTP